MQHEWNIKPEDIVSLIEGLEANNRVLELEWKCPGRRGPSPVLSNNRQQEHGSQEYKLVFNMTICFNKIVYICEHI